MATGDEIQSGVVSEAAFVFRCAATRVRNRTFRVVLALRRALATALERCDAKLDRGRRCPVERGSPLLAAGAREHRGADAVQDEVARGGTGALRGAW